MADGLKMAHKISTLPGQLKKDVGLNEVGSYHQLTRDKHDFRKIAKKVIKKWPKKLMTTPTMPWAAQKDVGLTG